MCLGNISKDFTINNIKKKKKKKRIKKKYKILRQLVKVIIAHLFTCGEKKIWQNIKKFQNIMKLVVINGSNHTKCVSLSNRKSEI